MIEHIGGDPYWMGHLSMLHILTREGPPDHPWFSSLRTGCGAAADLVGPTPVPSPGEDLDTKGDALGSSARISCAAGQRTKGHGLCKCTASAAQECRDHRSPS